jgi:hypothetical protein
MVRQFLFDTWHYFLMRGLLNSTDKRIAEIAEKSLKEVTYHLRRSGDLVVRLGDGTPVSHAKMQAAVDELWTYAGEAFIYDEVDQAMVEQGVAPTSNRCAQPSCSTCRKCSRKRRWRCLRRTPTCSAAASRAGIPSASASSWPRCSSCSAPIPAWNGNDGGDGDRYRAQVWAWLGEVPDPEIPVISVVDLGIVRDVAFDGDTVNAW